MSQQIAGAIVLVVAVFLILAGVLAWRARLRRDSGLVAPLGVPEHAEVLTRYDTLYVATTKHDHSLERLAVRPLVYRARGELTITDRGAALSLDGSPTVFLASSRLIAADRATVTIDRVVEPGGLIRLAWRTDDGTVVDSYLRITGDLGNTDAAGAALTDLQRLCADSETGASA
ncbi:PH-like domain-containing protein [Microbacterium sp. 22242]|uniref:PH-like domain-containing protein n=1 Tax=Microbacterium sp. 22242 TaxID=3453896 RepID=UPI003F871D79